MGILPVIGRKSGPGPGLFRKQCAPREGVWGSTPLSSTAIRHPNRAYTQRESCLKNKNQWFDSTTLHHLWGVWARRPFILTRCCQFPRLLHSSHRKTWGNPREKIRLGSRACLESSAHPSRVWGSTPLSSSETQQSRWAYTQNRCPSKTMRGFDSLILLQNGDDESPLRRIARVSH